MITFLWILSCIVTFFLGFYFGAWLVEPDEVYDEDNDEYYHRYDQRHDH